MTAPAHGEAWYALIDGSGFEPPTESGQAIETPYGEPSAPLRWRRRGGQDIIWLPRHGDSHALPPHRINYRANLYAIREAGARTVIGINTVGVITDCVAPGDLAVPEQLIDYTWGREHTYADGSAAEVLHLEFDRPFAARLRAALLAAAKAAGVNCTDGGTYAVTQGPRLETAAEIDRLERDGADVVGMTAMPEAALAAELGLDYAVLALAVNPAAGRTSASLHAEVAKHARRARVQADALLDALFEGNP
jgi:purine nucleoside phosphorylase